MFQPRPFHVVALILSGFGVYAPDLAGADASADPATITLERLRSANAARTDLARATSAWDAERQRLQALLDATRTETARLEREATVAEADRDGARQRLAALGSADEPNVIRERLARAGKELTAQFAVIAATMTPGTAPAAGPLTGDESYFDQAMRRLEAAERTASVVAVDVITGQYNGRPQAVKLLRVAGSVAWWASLDNTVAGTARLIDGVVQLEPAAETDRQAILAALAQAEGHAQPTIVMLPAPRPVEAR